MADVESGALLSNGWKRLARRSLAGAAFIAIALSGSGCSMFDQFNPFGGEKYKMEVTPDVPASKTYDQGLDKLANGSPAEAAKKFTDLGKQYPTSDWARKGLLMSTYAQYQAGDYTTAETSAERYLKDYPNSPEADYVLYLQANSYYMQIPDISRDQEKTAKALETFQSVVQKYPKSDYADDAKYKIQVTQDQLAGKEMSIGRFYLTRRNYTAAINRFRNVLQYYQTTRHAAEALYRLVEAYLGLGITEEAQTAAAVLGHNFPDSDWYHDAYDLLGAALLGAERGGQLDGIMEQTSHAGDWLARSVGLGVAVVTVSGATHMSEIQDPGDRRHRCEPVFAVVRRGPGEGEARGRSARQAGERAQALSQPGRHRDRRAHALRRLAKGRRRERNRRRRGADRRGHGQPLRRSPIRGRRRRERARARICRAPGRDGRIEAARRGGRPRRPAALESAAEVRRSTSSCPKTIRKPRSPSFSRFNVNPGFWKRTRWRSTSAFRARVFVRLTDDAADRLGGSPRGQEGRPAMSLKSLAPRMRQIPARKSAILSVLDIGASKIVCLIARLTPMEPSEALRGRTHRCKVLGIGHQRSNGVKGGAVVDLHAAEHAVRLAVDAAERMAGVEVGGVIINMSGEDPASRRPGADAKLRGKTVAEHDIHHVLEAAAAVNAEPGRTILHALPTAFRLNSTKT